MVMYDPYPEGQCLSPSNFWDPAHARTADSSVLLICFNKF